MLVFIPLITACNIFGSHGKSSLPKDAIAFSQVGCTRPNSSDSSPDTSAKGLQVIHGTIPGDIAKLGLKPLGCLNPTVRLTFSFDFPMRNKAEFDSLSQELYDPSSPLFHHWLTSAEFTAKFSPTQQNYQSVITYSKANGFSVTGTVSNRMVLEVSAPVQDVERAFHIQMLVYNRPVRYTSTVSRTFFAPDHAPSLDLATSIMDISGLNNYTVTLPVSATSQ
jgi:xanthomonalisin